MLNRWRYAAVSSLAFAFLGLMLSAPLPWSAHADQQTFELKVSLYTPAVNHVNKEIERWGEVLKEKSGGRIVLNLFPSSQMGPVTRQYDLVRTGVADISHVMQGVMPGRFPLTELAQLPDLIPNGRVGTRALMDVLPDLQAEYPGVKVLYVFTSEPMPILTIPPVHEIADLKGLRIRQPDPVHATLIKALGATPVGVQPADLSQALSRGTIDGLMMGYSGVSSFQLGPIARYSTELNGGVVTFALVMNPLVYDRMPPDLKKVIDETSGLIGAHQMSDDFISDDHVQRKHLAEQGIQFLHFSDASRAKFKTVAANIKQQSIARLESKGIHARAFMAKLEASIAKHVSDPN